ncbi:MAG: hypothetical protein ACLP5H_07435 [Desulfomonilaceae bacterium]
MELDTYCENLAVELSGWRVKVNDVVRKLDEAASGDKEKVVPEINDLHMIMEELDERINKLRAECPTAWEPQRAEVEGKMAHLKHTWEGVWENVSPGDAGG